MSYNKKELINAIQENLAGKEVTITKKVLNEVVDSFVEVVMKAVAAGDSVKMTGFGTFTASEHGARQLKNPRTGEIMEIGSYKAPKFKPSAVFKSGLKGEA